MKELVCRTVFGNLEEKIREVFSTSFLLHCYSIDNLAIYQDIFNDVTIKKLFNNGDILSTAKLFLENNLNLSQSSKKGFLHRNTMIYRLEKLKKITGLDIKNFNDAIIFANMLEMYKNLS